MVGTGIKCDCSRARPTTERVSEDTWLKREEMHITDSWSEPLSAGRELRGPSLDCGREGRTPPCLGFVCSLDFKIVSTGCCIHLRMLLHVSET